jgi:hypothetical protein
MANTNTNSSNTNSPTSAPVPRDRTASRGDGWVRPATPEDMRPGVVVRMVNNDGSVAPFSDHVVGESGDLYSWKLHRPYFGGTETSVTVTASRLFLFVVVLDSLGRPYTWSR